MIYRISAYILITLISFIVNIYSADRDPETMVFMLCVGVVASVILGLIFSVPLYYFRGFKKSVIFELCIFAIMVNATITSVTFAYYENKLDSLNEIQDKKPINKIIMDKNKPYILPHRKTQDINVLSKEVESLSIDWLVSKGYEVKIIDSAINPPHYFKRSNQFNIQKDDVGSATVWIDVINNPPNSKRPVISIDLEFIYTEKDLELQKITGWEDTGGENYNEFPLKL